MIEYSRLSVSHRGEKTPLIDQALGVPWSLAFDYISAANQTEQTFVPMLPLLVAVEVDIHSVNPGRGDDTITLEILDDGGAVLVSLRADVAGDFDGWLRFDIEGGLDVAAGRTLTIRLTDAGNTVFGWKYIDGDLYEPGSRSRSNSPNTGDFLFRTFGVPPLRQ